MSADNNLSPEIVAAPWRVGEMRGLQVDILDANGRMVARTFGPYFHPCEADELAKLVASAPDQARRIAELEQKLANYKKRGPEIRCANIGAGVETTDAMQEIFEHRLAKLQQPQPETTTTQGVFCQNCGVLTPIPMQRVASPLGAETRAATSRGAHSTEDAGRLQPSPPPNTDRKEIDELRWALRQIVERCSAPVNEMAQREAVHFAYNTATVALLPKLVPEPDTTRFCIMEDCDQDPVTNSNYCAAHYREVHQHAPETDNG